MFLLKKIGILVCLLFILSGCTVNYNVTIDENNIKEDINVNDNITDNRTKEDIISFYNSWYPVYLYDGIIDDYSTKLDDAIYYNKSNIIENGDTYNYTFSYNHKLKDYPKTTIWSLYLLNNSFITDNNKISISSGKSIQIFNNSAITNLNINITTNLKVLENNADRINDNTYTWEYNLNNYRSKSVKLVLAKENNIEESPSNSNQSEEEKTSNSNNEINKESSNMILILSILGVFLLVLIILLKFRKI